MARALSMKRAAGCEDLEQIPGPLWISEVAVKEGLDEPPARGPSRPDPTDAEDSEFPSTGWNPGRASAEATAGLQRARSVGWRLSVAWAAVPVGMEGEREEARNPPGPQPYIRPQPEEPALGRGWLIEG